MSTDLHDREVEQFRALLQPPSEIKDGFGWSTVAGIFFCGLVMMPGSIYLGLMTGGGIGSAAQWVTVILFMEIARRAIQPLKRENLVILLHAANVMLAANALFPGGPLAILVSRAYLAGSSAIRDAGMYGTFPKWFVPAPDSPAITERTFFHHDWIIPIAVLVFLGVVGLVQRYTLGYFFFRLTSDVENLPFPLAPITAQGSLALSESEEKGDPTQSGDGRGKKKTSHWRIFTLGALIGLGFGFLQVGIPSLTGLFLAKPFYLIPQPFVDTTTFTQAFLPATPTGIVLDVGIILLGFVLPYWAVIGTFAAIIFTVILNGILYHYGILHTWQPGMDTVNTTYANGVDFWISFGIGSGIGIAAVSVFSTVRDMRTKMREINQAARSGLPRKDIWAWPRSGRGDYPLWIALAIYAISAGAVVLLCWYLLPKSTGILFFLIFFAFGYNPFISYVNARLLGISGQSVDIPYVKEGAFILAGAKGIEIWLAPVPLDNFGYQAQSFRVSELTGVSFWSLIKTELVALPLIFFFSFLFWQFIWHANAVPSAAFPYAQKYWDLWAKNSALLYSSTFVPTGQNPADVNIEGSEFMKAIHPAAIGGGLFGTILVYVITSGLGWPVMLVYGLIRGLGGMPHGMLLELVGALWGRYYFQKKMGETNFLLVAPTLLAGYFTGVGLMSMATISLQLIKSAVSSAPF